jgi:hypothetical protein
MWRCAFFLSNDHIAVITHGQRTLANRSLPIPRRSSLKFTMLNHNKFMKILLGPHF